MNRSDKKKLATSLLDVGRVKAAWEEKLAKHEYSPSAKSDLRTDRHSLLGFASLDPEEIGARHLDSGEYWGRRGFNMNLLAVYVAAASGAAGVLLAGEAEDDNRNSNELRDRQLFSVDADYANDLMRREYNDSIFEFAAKSNLQLGMAILHNSFYFARIGDTAGLISNLADLKLALKHTEDRFSKAAVLQRIAVNNILLGQAAAARDAANKIDLGLLDKGTISYSKTLDLRSTSSLNALDRTSLRQFNGFEDTARDICNNWNGIPDLTTATVDQFVDQSDTFMSSISCAVQAKWIRKIQLAKHATDAQLGVIRREWVDEMVSLISRVANRPYALLMAEDFHYWLCRPAFHALRCRDKSHVNDIIKLHFDSTYNGRVLPNHVLQANAIVRHKRSPNTQWFMLLKAVSELLQLTESGRAQARLTLDDLFRSRGEEAFQVKNTAISKAATDVAIGISNDSRGVAWIRDLVNRYWPIPNVESNGAYYNLIRAAALDPSGFLNG